MEIPQLDGLINILTKVNKIVNVVAPIVNAIVGFMLPMLLFMGNHLRNFILFVNNYVTIGNYTWFIVITSITVVGAIVLCFLFPGEKPEKDN